MKLKKKTAVLKDTSEENKQFCKKILDDTKQALDKSISDTNSRVQIGSSLVQKNRALLNKKAPYVTESDMGSFWASSY